MATQTQPNSISNSITISQATNLPVYESCLLVTRHRLLQSQENDLMKICQRITKVDTLPNNIDELKKMVDFYSAVVGVIPLPYQIQILQLKKDVILFYMESLGVAMTKQEAEEMLKKSGLEGVILPPAKEGEPYRISIYRGLLRVKEIKVVDEFLIKHDTQG